MFLDHFLFLQSYLFLSVFRLLNLILVIYFGLSEFILLISLLQMDIHIGDHLFWGMSHSKI